MNNMIKTLVEQLKFLKFNAKQKLPYLKEFKALQQASVVAILYITNKFIW